MAEGGKPLEPEGDKPLEPKNVEPKGGKTWKEEMEEADSLHLLFARDLVTYVMRRRIPNWSFSKEYSTQCPVTPFSYRIRHATDFYLNKECRNFDGLFFMVIENQELDLAVFTKVIKLAVNSIYMSAHSYNDLLRFLFLFAHLTEMAFERGVGVAPYFALFNMQELLRVYTERKCVHAEVFYAKLGFKAKKLINEEAPLCFHDYYY